MFVSKGQFFNLLLLFGSGLFFGVIFDLLTPLKDSKRILLKVFSLIIYFTSCFFCYLTIKITKNVGQNRFYMVIIFLLGMYISYIIFHKTLAIFYSKVYNIFDKCLKAFINTLKKLFARGNYAGRKVKKVNSFVGGDSGSFTIHTTEYYGLSNDSHCKRTQKNRRVKSKDSRTRTRNRGNRC